MPPRRKVCKQSFLERVVPVALHLEGGIVTRGFRSLRSLHPGLAVRPPSSGSSCLQHSPSGLNENFYRTAIVKKTIEKRDSVSVSPKKIELARKNLWF